MIATKQEIYSVLREFNPWWSGITDLGCPKWKRAAYRELKQWMINPPSKRAVLVSGARQVGKTTLFRQTIQKLIANGVDPEKILYVTFDHYLLKLVGLEGVIKLWEELGTSGDGIEYLFLDEIQNNEHWQTWLKHQVDFRSDRRIAATGSAMPLNAATVESGVGRWHTTKVPTLSFYEYLRIKDIELPSLPDEPSLIPMFLWSEAKRLKVSEDAKPLVPHFHEYLLRGGFPETALVESVNLAQKLLREDIVEKVLKRDMTAVYGIRNVLDLEKLFVYLCLNDGGILDVTKVGSSLKMTRPTANNYINALESAHLIYRLNPYGYGKEVLRGKPKVYLADAALSGSVLLKGRELLKETDRLGAAVETVFFKHLFTRYYQSSMSFSYWREKDKFEVDIICQLPDRIVPFEVKYQSKITEPDFRSLVRFCGKKDLKRAYMITRNIGDFFVNENESGLQTLAIPAPLACYWLSKSEFDSNEFNQ